MRSRRGGILGVVVAVVTLALLAVLTVAGISTQHLHQPVLLRHHEEARLLAESAIAQAVEKVHAGDHTWGSHGTPDESITVNSPGGQAFLTFCQPTATAQNIPYSTY